MSITHELRLIYENKIIILHCGSYESCKDMLGWYLHHKDFFNGEFSIVKIDYSKTVYKDGKWTLERTEQC